MVKIDQLNFAYHGDRRVLRDINLNLQPGHIYGLLGKNGSGKSTLLKCMAGLVFPTAGACLLNGQNTALRSVGVLQELYFIPEDIYVPALSPEQFVNNTAIFYPRFDWAQFVHFLQLLEVDPKRPMNKLSYGQQKKAMVAFGLATGTRLLIMDEPTNGLDIPSKIQFRKLIAAAVSDDRCIVISTHQVRDLDNLIDTLLLIDQERVTVNVLVDELSDKLIFGFFDDTTGLDVIYSEETLKGHYVIARNTTGKYSRTDLELLFNAVVTGNPALLEILKEGGTHV
ncbi:ATP-binding cassette domain-containing protein [Mucilaginibacter sp. UR6-11]|uniref:ABC transporter ATP-binding protein n=1 Tax=Mucilaginibacter sp. UR6-11 TaxID=1435644 RepID=UPI001E5DD06D|nr:ABC transporter ATP-binding protein [Mucilaginibacter sp. UR6-11]MCC8425796.1 ABC transporter ATP-binding protein [Mucilaginibacter sp. UR6-11]